MKKILVYLLSFMVLVLSFCYVTAINVIADTQCVYDDAKLLSITEERDLTNLAQTYSQQYGVEVVFLTFNDAHGASTMVYTDDFYDIYIAKPNGILFAIDMDNREIYINIVGSCIDEFSDSEINSVLDDVFPYIVRGEYYQCLSKMCIYSFEKMNANDGPVSFVNVLLPPRAQIMVSIILTVIVVGVAILKHLTASTRPSTKVYNKNFKVKQKDTMFLGSHDEVLRDHYRPSDSGSSRSGGGSRHTSSRGVSHGGGGRKF